MKKRELKRRLAAAEVRCRELRRAGHVELSDDEQSAQWKVERALSGLPLVRSVLLVGMRARQELARKAEGRH